MGFLVSSLPSTTNFCGGRNVRTMMNKSSSLEEPSPDCNPDLSDCFKTGRERKKIPSVNTTLGEVSTCPEFQPPSGTVGSTRQSTASTQRTERFGLVQGWKQTLMSWSCLSRVVLLACEMGAKKRMIDVQFESHSGLAWPVQEVLGSPKSMRSGLALCLDFNSTTHCLFFASLSSFVK